MIRKILRKELKIKRLCSTLIFHFFLTHGIDRQRRVEYANNGKTSIGKCYGYSKQDNNRK